jgi:hypothetical protein
MIRAFRMGAPMCPALGRPATRADSLRNCRRARARSLHTRAGDSWRAERATLEVS